MEPVCQSAAAGVRKWKKLCMIPWGGARFKNCQVNGGVDDKKIKILLYYDVDGGYCLAGRKPQVC